jgi:phage-related holin
MSTTLLKLYTLIKANLLYIVPSAWLVSFFLPLKDFLVLSVLLVICDTITGLIAAYRKKETITSRGLYRMVEKMTVYMLSIVMGGAMHYVFFRGGVGFLPDIPVVHIVSASICFTEFLSFRENIIKITGVDILGSFNKSISVFLAAMPAKILRK